MTPKRKQLFISSLGLCTAYWLFPAEGNTALAATVDPSVDEGTVRMHIAEEALFRHYNPLASLEAVKPLKKSKEPLKYKIKAGDTLSEIAARYHLSTQKLATFNQINNIHTIRAGETLKIPYSMKEIRVGEEQDVQSLADKFEVPKKLLKKMNPQLEMTNSEMYIGQVVNIPEPIEVTAPPPSPQQSQPHLEKKRDSVHLASRSKGESPEKKSTSREKQPESFSGQLAWPVGGQMTSGYGVRNGRMHHGIDIWNTKEGKTPIQAAAPGVVARAGHQGNYGNLIVIDHGDGWVTYYAHLRAIQVSKGQSVNGGAQIGYMGKSGNATGYHLHFEVRKNDASMNPLDVLP